MDARRIRTIPGIGPINAAAFLTCDSEMEDIIQWGNFATWPAPVPKRHSTGGKTRPAKASEMGQSEMRRPLASGASSLISAAKRNGTDSRREEVCPP